MTAFDYVQAKADAEELIADFGQAAQITRATAGSGPAYDPGEGAADTYDCTLVVLEYTDRERDGTLILAGDKKAFISTSGLTIAPVLSDKIVTGTQSHNIVNIKPLSPAGMVLLYEIQIRR